MAAANIHYEIFMKRTPKHGWTLIEAVPDRQDAIIAAKALLRKNKTASVRVAKETFDPASGEFRDLTIFEEGAARMDMASRDAKAEIPCFQPEDLYSLHASQTIARVLSGHLGRYRLTVTELMHRADAIERLEANGAELQGAIQKIALAQAEEKNQPVHELIRQYNDLIRQAIEKVYDDEAKGRFIDFDAGGLRGVAKAAQKKGAPQYFICAAIARRLASEESWAAKLHILLDLMNELPSDDAGRQLCLDAIDRFVSEILEDRAQFEDLYTNKMELQGALKDLVEVFIAAAPPSGDRNMKMLSDLFKEDKLPASRAALARRIISELRSSNSFCKEGVFAEIKYARKLASRIVLGQGKYLVAHDIADAFSHRCRRFVTPEAIGQLLENVQAADRRIKRLLELEENLVGAENRRRLADILDAEITSTRTEEFFLKIQESSVARIARVAQLQREVGETAFDDADKARLAGALDKVACFIESNLGLLASIERQTIATAEKVIALLRLIDRGALTEGECEMRARRLAIKMMRDPKFMDGLLKSDSSSADPKKLLAELKQLLTRTGLNSLPSEGDPPAGGGQKTDAA
ncbi:MAG: hypothetical protein Tsb0010_13320 [Parvularculaceae bacterium]